MRAIYGRNWRVVAREMAKILRDPRRIENIRKARRLLDNRFGLVA